MHMSVAFDILQNPFESCDRIRSGYISRSVNHDGLIAQLALKFPRLTDILEYNHRTT